MTVEEFAAACGAYNNARDASRRRFGGEPTYYDSFKAKNGAIYLRNEHGFLVFVTAAGKVFVKIGELI